MAAKKNTLSQIAENKIKYAYMRTSSHLRIILDVEKFDAKVNDEFNKTIPKIQELEEDINIELFKKFISTPQINDLIKNYLIYLLTSSIAKKEPIIKKRNVLNYFIRMIESYFTDLNTEKSITSIKLFFSYLMDICNKKFDNSIYSKFVELKDNTPVFPFENNFTDEFLFYNLIKKIQHGIEEDIIINNIIFDKIKSDYTKVIKQYYQNDFIYLLGEYKFNDFYIAPILIGGDMDNPWWKDHISKMDIENLNRIRDNWTHIFDTKDIRYIIGGAGFGKSLFLKNLINNINRIYLDNPNDYLIIYCDLKSYYTNGKTKTMVDFFQESMINCTSMDDISKEFIQYYLKIGRCLILLDALDEVPKDKRNELHKKIVTFLQTNNPNNKACITSRDRGFIPQPDIEVLNILPLTRKDIEAYIDKMIALKKFKKTNKEIFMKQAESLIQKEFLNNFLILSLLVNIFKAEKELPENKIDLYEKCFEYIAKKREFQNNETGYDWKNISCLMKKNTFISLSVLAAPNNKDINREAVEQLLLQEYKFKYKDEVSAEQAINEFLEFCSNRTELFVLSSTDDKFKFFHRSFFEYFYSRYIYQQADVETMYDLMSKFDVDSEVFELTIALVKEDNEVKYQKLLEYIFEKVEEELSSEKNSITAFGILTLAMQVVDDAYFISKYYNIIIKYNNVFVNEHVNNNLNQKLIGKWIDKHLNDSIEKQNEFINTFSYECSYYLLKMFAEPNIQDKKLQFRLNHLFESGNEIEYHFSLSTNNIPFYLILYSKYSNIFTLLEDCITSGFNDIWSKSKRNWDKKAKNLTKKGYHTYKQLPIEKRKKVLESFSKTIKDSAKTI